MYGPPTRTVNDVFRSVKRQFGDESGAQLEDNDIIMWINEALDEVVKRNKILKSVATANSVQGQQEYTFPTDEILQIESLHYGGVFLRNMPFPVAERTLIDDTNPEGLGEPSVWYEWAGVFYLWPVPNSVKEIKLFYTKKPTHVATIADVLSISDKYFMSVIQYVLGRAYEMDDDLEASELKNGQFREGIDFMAEEERTAQNMTYQTISVIED